MFQINCSTKTTYSNFLIDDQSRYTAASFSGLGNLLCMGTTDGHVKMYSFNTDN